MDTKLPRLIVVVVVLLFGFMVFMGIATAQSPKQTHPDSLSFGTPAKPAARLEENGIMVAPNDPSYTVTLGLWRNTRPTESYLRSVSMLPSSYQVDCTQPKQKSKGWIVGDDGVILSYCNGIWDHAIIVESVPTSLFDVQAISPTLGVAVGEDGAVLMYLYDQIAQAWVWTKSPIPVGDKLLYSVAMVPDGTGGYTGWVVGEKDDVTGRGTLIHGTITPSGIVNGAQTYTYSWINVTSNYPNLPEVDTYSNLQMISPTNAWAVGGIEGQKGVIIHWNGTTWSTFQEVGTQLLLGLDMLSDNEGWATGVGGVIYHFNGTNWSGVASPTTQILFTVGFSPNGEGWIAGVNGTLLNYLGGSWQLFTDLRTDPFDFWAMDFTSGHGWMVGFHLSKGIGGQILEYDQELWLAVTPPTDNQINAISIIADDDAWAVGAADTSGGTVIHWDGKHWQRWYQSELTLPSQDLYAIDMVSKTDGWAAGDTVAQNEPAVFLHWDGHRWAQPRYDAPVNVRVNALDMMDSNFGWAVADSGNAVAKYDGTYGYWNANHTHAGLYYQLRDTTIFTSTVNPFGWDAWSVGTKLGVAPPTPKEWFMRYMYYGPSVGYEWGGYDTPVACPHPPDPVPSDGSYMSTLYGIQISPDQTQGGYATGEYHNRATIYRYYMGVWSTDLCEPDGVPTNPSRWYSVDIVRDSGIAWFGGFYWDYNLGRKTVYINYHDDLGYWWGEIPLPINGRNIYHRPIRDLRMSSDTMGWAVGDPEDARKLSIIYQYPFPNFTLTGVPHSQVAKPGSQVVYQVLVNTLGGFGPGGLNVNLDVYDVPPLASYNIKPGIVSDLSPGVITFTLSASTPLGVYDITVDGDSTFYSGDHQLQVTRDTKLRLTVTNDPVYSVDPTRGPAGTVVTITGAGFGNDPGVGNRSTTTNHVILAGKQMPDDSVLTWSSTKITVKVPDDVTLFPQGPVVGEVSVTASGTRSNTDLSFLLENYLTGVSIQDMGDQIQVTLTGTGLGSDPGALLRSTIYEHVSLNGAYIPTGNMTSWSNNTITFTIPIGTQLGYVTVTSNGFASNVVYFNPMNNIYLPLTQR